MTPTRSAFAFCALFLLVASAAPARDLEDVLLDVTGQLGVSTPIDGSIFGPIKLDQLGLDQFDSLNQVSSNVVNDRVLPVSSSVSGFTFEYNPDLDVYERSTSTFGPLFTERAQTIGRRRGLVSMSTSYLAFDEFEGDSISDLRATSLQPGLRIKSPDASRAFEIFDVSDQIDVSLDLDLKETVAAFQFTYGISDYVDIGVVVPLIHVDLEARATAISRVTGQPLPTCPPPGNFGTNACVVGSATTTKESEDYTGLGDTIVRAKWHFLRNSFVDAAALGTATIPTGDPDNLTGFHHMTFKPGVVFSRDLITGMGGVSLHGGAAWEIRPNDSEFNEVEWAAGAALQPFRRTSLSLDVLGSRRTGSTRFGKNRVDGSIGTKIMVTDKLLAAFNLILPINDDGLRSDAIYTAQFEYSFGD